MWSRKQAILEAPPVDTWPTFDESELEERRLERFRASVDAIKRYFRQEPVRDIERITGVARTDLSKLAKKCLLAANDGRIMGFRALEPYARFGPYKRMTEVKRKRPEQQGGQAGALGQFLERFPDLEQAMVKLIRQEAKAHEVSEFRLRRRDLHRFFIAYAKKAGVGQEEWPLNTKYLGIRSIERFMGQVLDRNFARTASTRGERDAKAHLAVGTGHDAFLIFEQPYDAVEIDAYDIECHLTVSLQTPEGTEVELLLERLWLIAAVERFTGAVLSYTVVYRSEVTADDVLRVIRDAVTGRWQPLELTLPELRYPSEGGIPSGVIPAAYGAVWSVTMFDGALAHLSGAIHDRARKTLGFAINWGAVGHFERRPNVERFFKQIAQDLFKRLPSTTGSNPQNGRAKDAEKKAVRHRIRAADVKQLLDVSIAQLNCTPSSGTSYLSPLESLRYFLEDPDQAFLVRRLPSTTYEVAKTFACREEVTVRGGKETGRRPYIQLDKAKYSSPVLANAGHLVGHSLIAEIDEEDFRQIRVFLKSGAELGILKVQGKWGLTKHSRRTRQAINRLVHRRLLVISEFDDPVQAYMRYLSQPENAKKSLSPKQTTELTRVAEEAGKTPKLLAPRRSPANNTSSPDRVEKTLPAVVRPILDTDNSFFTKVKNRR